MKWALVLGVAGVIGTYVSYLVGHRFYLTWGNWLVYILCAIVMYKAATAQREEEGVLSFGNGFIASWVPYVLGSLLVAFFTYLLFNVIDPSLTDSMKEVQLEALEKMSGFLGEDGLEKAQEAIEDQEMTMGLGTSLMGWAFGLVFPGAVMALIVAAITKRNN